MQQPADSAKEIIKAASQDVARIRERRAAADAASMRPKQQVAVIAALSVALPVLGLLYVTNIEGRSLKSLITPNPPPAIARQRAEEALHTFVDGVETFRSDYSELPYSVTQIGTPIDGDWTLIKISPTRYQVTLSVYGQTVTYTSQEIPRSPQEAAP